MRRHWEHNLARQRFTLPLVRSWVNRGLQFERMGEAQTSKLPALRQA